jgi:hypothetical protein
LGTGHEPSGGELPDTGGVALIWLNEDLVEDQFGETLTLLILESNEI